MHSKYSSGELFINGAIISLLGSLDHGKFMSQGWFLISSIPLKPNLF